MEAGSGEDFFGLPYSMFGVPVRYRQKAPMVVIDTCQLRLLRGSLMDIMKSITMLDARYVWGIKLERRIVP